MQGLHSDVFGDEHMSVSDGDNTEKVMDMEKMVNNFEKTLIKHACEQYGSTRKVAKAIGISQTQLVRKKKKYDI